MASFSGCPADRAPQFLTSWGAKRKRKGTVERATRRWVVLSHSAAACGGGWQAGSGQERG